MDKFYKRVEIMFLDIILPLILHLNDLKIDKNIYKNSKKFVLFDSYISKEELSSIEKEIYIKSLVSDITNLFFNNQDKEAYQKVQELLQFKEAEFFYYYFLAVWESKQENNLKAQIFIEKSLQINPELDSAWNLYGYLQSLSGNYKKAIESFSKAIELEPYHPVYRFNLARTYWLLKDKENALKEIDICIKLRDNFPDAYYLKGLILENSHLEEALNNYNLALERNFNEDEFYKKFLTLALKNNHRNYLLKILNKTNGTLNQELLIMRFEIFLQYGEYNKAISELFKILQNILKTKEEFEQYTDTLNKASILNCYYKKDIETFIKNNRKNLSEYKIQFLEKIISQKCSIPVKLKDPLINPAL